MLIPVGSSLTIMKGVLSKHMLLAIIIFHALNISANGSKTLLIRGPRFTRKLSINAAALPEPDIHWTIAFLLAVSVIASIALTLQSNVTHSHCLMPRRWFPCHDGITIYASTGVVMPPGVWLRPSQAAQAQLATKLEVLLLCWTCRYVQRTQRRPCTESEVAEWTPGVLSQEATVICEYFQILLSSNGEVIFNKKFPTFFDRSR